MTTIDCVLRAGNGAASMASLSGCWKSAPEGHFCLHSRQRGSERSAAHYGGTSMGLGWGGAAMQDGNGVHELASSMAPCRLLKKASPLKAGSRTVMALAVEVPVAPPADGMVSPLPWIAQTLERLEALPGTSGEEEYLGRAFDDAEAQKDLELAKALSQINALAKAAMKSAEASKILEAERVAIEEETKLSSKSTKLTDFLTPEDYVLLEEARKQEAAGRTGEASPSSASRVGQKTAQKAAQKTKRPASRRRQVDKQASDVGGARSKVKTLQSKEAMDARVRKKAAGQDLVEQEVGSSLPETKAMQRRKKRAERAATWQRWKERPAEAQKVSVEDTVGTMMANLGSARLLTPKEELECATCIKEKIQWERIREVMAEELGRPVSLDEVAESIGMSSPSFREKWAQGDLAKDLMVRSNLRLVVSVAKKYAGRNMDFTDLVQEGNLGLIKGVEKYDHTKGFRFSTYAHWWIRQAISRAVAENSRTIRLPVHMYEAISKVYRAKRLLADQLGRPGTAAEIAELCGFPAEKVQLCLAVNKPILSLDRDVAADRPGKKLIDTLIVEEDDTQEVMKKGAAINSAMMNVLHTLNPKERDVISMRYGLNGCKVRSLEEIGKIFQVTRERIRQVEQQALRKLRQPARNHTLQDFVDEQA